MVFFSNHLCFLRPLCHNRSCSQSGQIGVIVLLIMVVLLTIGISVASRTSQDLFLAQQQVDSARVFNAAEAGVEEALATNFDFEGMSFQGQISDFFDTNVDVAYSITKNNQLEFRLFELVGVKIDVDGFSPGNGLDIRWSQVGNCAAQDVASVLVTTFIDQAGEIRSEHQAFAGCDRGDNFLPSTTLLGDPYFRRVVFPIPDDALFIRITPVYADTHLFVAGSGWTLPVQSYSIRSEAENVLGSEFRAVEVISTLDGTPSIMDYTVFSGTDIIK